MSFLGDLLAGGEDYQVISDLGGAMLAPVNQIPGTLY